MKIMKRIVSLALALVICLGALSMGAFAAEAKTVDTAGEWKLVLVSEKKQGIETYAAGEKTGTWTGDFALYHGNTLAVTCTAELKYKYSSADGTSSFTSKEVTKSANYNGYSRAVAFSNQPSGNQARLRIVGIKDSNIYEGDVDFTVSSSGVISFDVDGVIVA